ncbi:hybrid sensor histidine kinase/response regulator transcription factor [Desertivirga brevis]|uniref:hybrid sensor histidine kinase/response regulator transcription factor n=1 Tax=Desertivirga brevis TaxID=2810310 RepID=UPI001A97493A|nr:hybrid sensor histidine kinase/response regulator transcription factor [Pedobacter sp. SYSU D00873]
MRLIVKLFACPVLFLLLSNLAGFSQDIQFKHISFREGLAQSPISTIFKDSKGFIWIGNWKGLIRYDGYEFKTFSHKDNDSSSLSNNRVNAICQDNEERLWVGTSHGLNIYDKRNETFRAVGIQKQVKGGANYISSVIRDEMGNIWVGSFGGVKLADPTRFTVSDVESFRFQKDLYSGVVFTLFKGKQKQIWAGTRKGVQTFDPATKKVLMLPEVLRKNEALSNAKVLVITQDKSGNMWFGTESSGLFKYDKEGRSLIQYQQSDQGVGLASNWIKGLLPLQDNKIWIGTRAGLSIFDPLKNTFSNHHHSPFNTKSLSDNTIWSFLADDAGSIWVGTFAGGLNIYNPLNANFQNIGEKLGPGIGLSNSVVNAIIPSGDGGFWTGTHSGGLNYVNPKKGESRSYSIKMYPNRSSNYIKTLAEDGKGNIWVGTLDGLALFNKESKETKYFSFPVEGAKLSGSLVNFVLPDREGVWAGTNGSGLRFRAHDGTVITFQKSEDRYSIADNFVTALLKDAKGNLWVGTQGGLSYFDVRQQKFTRRYRKAKERSLSHSTVLCLFRDRNQRLWIGTEGGGLNYFDPASESFYSINQGLGLSDNVVHSIIEDNSKNIWVSTDDGLFKIHFNKFVVPFSRKNVEVTQYTANDGLASNQFLTNAAIKTKDGKLFFGGINGLTSFHPEKILKNNYKPLVVLTDLLIKNKKVNIGDENQVLEHSISETSDITLEYDQGFITLRFAALNYVNPANNRYAYKLEGLKRNDDWNYSGTNNTANYTNLEPGTYTFKVKAANNDGIWNNEPTVLKIKVLPPLWRTWWAYLLYLITITIVATVILRFLKIRSDLERNLYFEHRENERQKELYQQKLDFFTNISHEIRTPLTLIVGPLEKALGSLRNSPSIFNQLNIVRNNAERLMRLVNELLDFRKAESGNMKLQFSECDIQKFVAEIFLSFKGLAATRNIHYMLIPIDKPIKVYFDKDQLEKVLFNILSNAFKFTPDNGKITVKLEVHKEVEREWVNIIISDNGKGIPEEFHEKLFENFFQVEGRDFSIGTGIGLALSKSIMELHKGSIKVKSRLQQNDKPGETSFTVTLLIGKEHLENEVLVPAYMNSDNADLYQVQSAITEWIEDDVKVPVEKRHTVLVVEDNEDVRQFIKDALNSQYHILESADGVEGLSAAFENIPDLIVSDVMMPKMDGLDFCRRVKNDERTSHIPVLLLTARTAYIHQVHGFDKGADAYITKPFSVQILQLQVRNILASKDALRLKYSSQLILQPQNFTVESPEEKFLQRLMEIVEKNMESAEFGVADLVDEIGMSKTVLYKKVQALTGISIGDFIKSIRLKRAAMLLQQNKIGIAEVAYSVGFNDRKYFSKEFKKQYNLSPSEYIQQFSPEEG